MRVEGTFRQEGESGTVRVFSVRHFQLVGAFVWRWLTASA